jgi:hypothetical protein
MNNFYINRLKTFSLAEYPYRIRQMMVRKLEQFISMHGAASPLSLTDTRRVLEPDFCAITELPDHMHIFGRSFTYDFNCAEDWHTDIFSGKRFPLSFSKGIDIRRDPGLSAKAVWEINRMQFLLPMAIHYSQTKDPQVLKKFVHIIRSWKESNPYLRGVNWYSNIEVNLRLINWFLCWEAMDVDALCRRDEVFRSFVHNDWLPLIHLHCQYSYENPSRFSSANNHLIAEYAGLFIASVKWSFKESAKWIRYAQKGLEKEIALQHSENGINREEAAEYIQFITDFFLLSFVVGKNAGLPFSPAYTNRLRQIFDYIFHFLDGKGDFPKYGDEDDGKCFVAELTGHNNNFKSLLSSGAILFGEARWKAKSGGFDRKNELLYGREGRRIFDSLPDVELQELSRFYEKEGHFICRKTDGDKEVFFHFDAAPLGYLSIAAHGHADALSFLLHVDGQPIFVDPGTYTYHTERDWRNYFVSTLAHNTVRIDRKNQAEFAGSTLWLKHFSCKVLNASSNEIQDIIEASHNGYTDIGILHKRKVVFDKRSLVFTITDTIIPADRYRNYFLEMPFHLHPDVGVLQEKEKRFSLKSKAARRLEISLDPALKVSLVKGRKSPEPLGWYSESFMVKQETNTLIGELSASGEIELKTIITIKAS